MAIDLPQPIVFGDTSGDLSDHAMGLDQTISLAANIGTRTLIGDASSLLHHATGGADALTGFAIGVSIVIGDAITISDHGRGGDDHVIAGASGQAEALGDAVTLGGHAQGGDDFVEADSDFSATAYGDAGLMTDHSRGGNDVVTGTNGHGFAVLYGDAQTLSQFATGGDDTLIASNGGATTAGAAMYGDGQELLDHARGGNDTLISGSGNDQMWGDAAIVAPTAHTGADTFIFSPPNGHDTVMDFQRGQDHIELKGYVDITNFSQLSPHITDTAAGSVITFDSNNSILVANDHHLTSGDFLFV